MEAIGTYETSESKEAENILERIVPRLSHSNPAVILSAAKVILKFLPVIENQEKEKAVLKKMAAPLVSLLSSEAEIQYVALRNISFVLQKYSNVFAESVKVFYCKFNDPVYVKLEKIEVLVKVTNESNVEAVLGELKEYANDLDTDIVKRSVKAIGQLILKIDKASKRAIEILHEIINQGSGYGLQEAVVVAKDIFRKFPNKYEHMIRDFALKYREFFEPDSKAAIVWIIGEYSEKIEKVEEIMNEYIDTFLEEPVKVQL
mmetsp:Transcript_45836/g.33571  ORF Transcript_45836/g.33571 Transcript_45836/m.33571 type:complete len:260 (+) Transcript_45836:690-1469(+)